MLKTLTTNVMKDGNNRTLKFFVKETKDVYYLLNMIQELGNCVIESYEVK